MSDDIVILDIDSDGFQSLLAQFPQGDAALKVAWQEDEMRPIPAWHPLRLRQITFAYDRGQLTRDEYLRLGEFEHGIAWWAQ